MADVLIAFFADLKKKKQSKALTFETVIYITLIFNSHELLIAILVNLFKIDGFPILNKIFVCRIFKI